MSNKNFDPWGGPGRPPAGDHGSHQGSLEYSYLAHTLYQYSTYRQSFNSTGYKKSRAISGPA